MFNGSLSALKAVVHHPIIVTTMLDDAMPNAILICNRTVASVSEMKNVYLCRLAR